MSEQTRQEFIRAAISFLQNPKLVDSSLNDKIKFLKDKGLSQVEVDEALNRALAHRHNTRGGRWNFLLVLGLCIGGYKLYQAYLESKQRQSLAQTSPKHKEDEATPSKHEREKNGHPGIEVPTLHDILEKMSELKRLLELQRSTFASDIQSLKTLLLGHEKFAAPPVIPAWQLKGSADDESKAVTKDRENDKNEKKKSDKYRKGTPHNNEFIDAKASTSNNEQH